MSRFLDPRLNKLEPYTPGEQTQDPEVLKLNTNESPYPVAPPVVEALSREKIENLRLYNDPEARRLKEALADYLGLEADQVFIGNGSDDVLNFAFQGLCTGRVAFPEISYGFYQVYANLHGLEAKKIPLEEDWSINPKDYYALGQTIFIANPNAPTGLALSLEEIRGILDHNPDNLVVIDEAYIAFGGESALPLLNDYDNLLITRTYSKSRSLAGARLGFGLGSKEIIADLEMLKYSSNPYNVNTLSQELGLATLAADDYYQEKIQEIIQSREETAEALRQMGFYLTKSQANFLFARPPQALISAQELFEELRARKILVRYFGPGKTQDYLRISIGRPEEMKRFCRQVKEILDQYKERKTDA